MGLRVEGLLRSVAGSEGDMWKSCSNTPQNGGVEGRPMCVLFCVITYYPSLAQLYSYFIPSRVSASALTSHAHSRIYLRGPRASLLQLAVTGTPTLPLKGFLGFRVSGVSVGHGGP